MYRDEFGVKRKVGDGTVSCKKKGADREARIFRAGGGATRKEGGLVPEKGSP